jgi:tetratricopeptide (TPR) repeat protein
LEKSNSEALKCYAKAIEANPYYIRALKETLEIYERQANDHGMLHILKKLHQESPDNPSYTLQLALTFLRQNFLTESEDFFRKTIRLSPKMAQAHRGLGDLFMHQEDYEMAMKQYYKALDLDGSDIKTLNAIGLTLVRLEKYDEGIAKYLAAIEIEKEHPGLHFNLGFAYEKKGDHKSAIEHYNRALIANPGFEKARRRITQISKQAS